MSRETPADTYRKARCALLKNPQHGHLFAAAMLDYAAERESHTRRTTRKLYGCIAFISAWAIIGWSLGL